MLNQIIDRAVQTFTQFLTKFQSNNQQSQDELFNQLNQDIDKLDQELENLINSQF